VKRPGPRLILALLVMGLGVIIGVVSIVKAVSPFVNTFRSSTHFSNEVVHQHLGSGEYRVYEGTGTTGGFGSTRFRDVGRVTIGPDNVDITDAAGRSVATDFVSNSETITRGERVYTAAVAFHIDEAGDYTIALHPRFPIEFIIGRSLGDTFKTSAPWIGTAALGGLIFILGLVLLIVGRVRRSRANRPAFAGAGPPGAGYGAPGAPAYATWPPRPQPPAGPEPGPAPGQAPPVPGWYTDPGGSNRLRYWDGNQWTDHTH
jgi:hypothetical protein